MCECGKCEDCILDMQEYAADMIDTYSNGEIAQMVREKVLTIEEVEAGLRRAYDRKAA